MTSSNGNIFRVTGPLCGEFTGPGEFPTQRPVTRSFDVFFDLRLNKRLSKQPWGWWFQTPSWSLWRQSNAYTTTTKHHTTTMGANLWVKLTRYICAKEIYIKYRSVFYHFIPCNVIHYPNIYLIYRLLWCKSIVFNNQCCGTKSLHLWLTPCKSI